MLCVPSPFCSQFPLPTTCCDVRGSMVFIAVLVPTTASQILPGPPVYLTMPCKVTVATWVQVPVVLASLIARFMGPTWGPSGADRTQVGPMLTPWTLLSGILQTIWNCLHFVDDTHFVNENWCTFYSHFTDISFPINKNLTLVLKMAWHRTGNKLLSKLMRPSLITHFRFDSTTAYLNCQ